MGSLLDGTTVGEVARGPGLPVAPVQLDKVAGDVVDDLDVVYDDALLVARPTQSLLGVACERILLDVALAVGMCDLVEELGIRGLRNS